MVTPFGVAAAAGCVAFADSAQLGNLLVVQGAQALSDSFIELLELTLLVMDMGVEVGNHLGNAHSLQ
ncbi:hypothetical protein D9M71_85580 [compost metagenome]